MNNADETIRKYRSVGVTIGIAIGIFTAFLLVGPHVHEWASLAIVLTFGGCVALGALLGYFVVEAIVGSLAGRSGAGTDRFGGSGDGSSDTHWNHDHGGHGHSHSDDSSHSG